MLLSSSKSISELLMLLSFYWEAVEDEQEKENKILFVPAGVGPRGLLDEDKVHPRQ